MSTTNFHIELVVVGAGVFLWIALLFAAAFNLNPAAAFAVVSWGNIAALLPIIYVLGIVGDRCADWLFDRCWQKKLWGQFTSIDEIHQARRAVLMGHERIADLMEYGRSRLRICRGWAFNGPFLVIGSLLYGMRSSLTGWQMAGIVCVLLGLTVLSFLSWLSLARSDYRKLHESWLAQQGEAKTD